MSQAAPPTAPPTTAFTTAPSRDEGAPTAGGGSLSPSRAADFLACPLLYRFRVVDRLPEPPNAIATRGTLVHGVLERLFGLPAVERTPARAADMVEPEWRRLVTEEPELAGLFAGESRECLARWLAGAEQLLSAYFALEDPRRVEPADRELCVETTLASGLRLRGYVDRLDVSSGGALRVIDYKTGRAPPPEIEARALFQMRFYALVLWRERDIVPRLLQLLFLGSGEVLSYRPDEADLLAMERKLEAVWRAISRAERDGDWRPRPGARCEWCAHREALCPAWGGTPPPLPASATSEASVASAEGPSAAVGGAGPVGGCPAGEGGAPSPYAAPDDI